MLWTLEASYFYYAHGPLARIETGQHNIQGTDYFYTLQGWIKGVNSIGLTYTWQDSGKDAAGQSTFNKDEYAYALNYYEGDYEARIGNGLLGKCFWFNEIYNNKFSGYKDAVGGVEYNRESLYNGNIAAMATSIRHFGELKSTQSMNYRYDQLHRIAAAEATEWGEQGWYTQQASYRTSYAYDGNGNIKKLLRNNRDGVKIDELRYSYDPIKKNRLDAVQDIGGTAEGLNNQQPYQYKYDRIGNLVQNTTDGIADIEWNIYGKVEKVTKTPDPFGIQATVEYRYDGTGNRIMKKITAGATSTTTTYLRDASGNVMAIYEEKTDQTLTVKEIPIYGGSRLGQYRPKTDTKKTALGQRIYEFSNHLGNVLVTLSDHKVPQTDGTYESVVLSASDYYPFGMAMAERTYSNSEYRYGFQGQEQSDELDQNGNSYTAEFWQYDAVIGRRWNVDPVDKEWESGYATLNNNPISMIDINGDNASDHYDKNGGHIAHYDDGDNGHYRHDDIEGDNTEQQLSDKVGRLWSNSNNDELKSMGGSWGGKKLELPEVYIGLDIKQLFPKKEKEPIVLSSFTIPAAAGGFYSFVTTEGITANSTRFQRYVIDGGRTRWGTSMDELSRIGKLGGRSFKPFPFKGFNSTYAAQYVGATTNTLSPALVSLKIGGLGFGFAGIGYNYLNTDWSKTDQKTYFYVENVPAAIGFLSPVAAILAAPIAASSYDKEATKRLTKETTEGYQSAFNQRQNARANAIKQAQALKRKGN